MEDPTDMTSTPDPIEQLAEAQHRRDVLNATPLAELPSELRDEAIAAAESAGLWERHDRLNAAKFTESPAGPIRAPAASCRRRSGPSASRSVTSPPRRSSRRRSTSCAKRPHPGGGDPRRAAELDERREALGAPPPARRCHPRPPRAGGPMSGCTLPPELVAAGR
jgi:hypothetical protein